MPATVLVLIENFNAYLPRLEALGFELILAQTPAARARAIADHAGQIDAVLTRGPLGLGAQEIDALPRLQIICVIGAGYEQVDLQAASNRGIAVTTGAGINASSVADHALALLLALVRGIPQADAAVRQGHWPKVMRPALTGMRLGVLGLGAVGQAIARRCALGLDMQVSYHSRQPRPDQPYRFCPTVLELARDTDLLMVATPGGAETRHLVGHEVLEALGPEGFLVNVARASVVDTEALLLALEQRKLAGAALDVFDAEPGVPERLKHLDNVVLTPHVAGLSPQASRDSMDMVGRNLLAHFSGQPLLTPLALPLPSRS